MSDLARKRARVAALLGVMSALQLAPAAHAAEKGDFDHLAPRHDPHANSVTFEGVTYTQKSTIMVDGDDNGTKETMFQFFTDEGNRRVGRLITKTANWGWAVYRDYANKSSSRNFAIFDLDGQGPPKFETRAKTSEDIPLPAYLK